MCERAREIVKGDVNGGKRVRIGENDMWKMGHYDERWRGREGEMERWTSVHVKQRLQSQLSIRAIKVIDLLSEWIKVQEMFTGFGAVRRDRTGHLQGC